MHIPSQIEWIFIGTGGLVLAAAVLYLRNKLHRRRMRQQQCFEALRIPCPSCGVQSDLACVGKDGAITFLHWSRVIESLQAQKREERQQQLGRSVHS
jgi:hypothetical protein